MYFSTLSRHFRFGKNILIMVIREKCRHHYFIEFIILYSALSVVEIVE